jgi:phosphoribosyl-ATP pyrophosphohydrolase
MILDDIARVVLERKINPPPGSYVASLLSGGKDAILKKIGEESTEVIIASKSGDRKEIIHELADLWFHCMVLMAAEGLSHEDVFQELEARYGAARKSTDSD